MTAQRHDLILYGATGFTGRIAAQWLRQHAPPGLSWAIAGRRRDALEALSAELGGQPSVRVADADDGPAIDAMVAETRVVITTAGPFARYGGRLLASCARQGVHYADITGETPWVRRMIDQHHDEAARSGAKVLPFCGFDSVPSDLGAWLLVRALAARGEPTKRVEAGFTVKGGFNGGTLASMLNLTSDELAAMRDPVLLNPSEHRQDALREASPELRTPRWSEGLGCWLAPFFMAPVNTRVVRRSAALSAQAGTPYGSTFEYQEGMIIRGMTPRITAWSISAMGALFEGLTESSAARALLQRLGPKPGEGPSEADRQGGFTRVRAAALGERGGRATVRLTYPGDPGNLATTSILCNAGLCLALDALPPGGGLLTPAPTLGAALVERLSATGWEIAVEEIAAEG